MGKLITIATFILLYGCSTPYSPPKIFDNPTFEGIEQQLTGSDNRALSIIAIHGMCHHNESWAIEKTETFSSFMDMDIVYPDTTPDYPLLLIGSTPSGISAYRSELIRKSDKAQISLYSIIFSAPSDKEKKLLCADVSRTTSICNKDDLSYDLTRAKLNANLKNKLLNDCLADAVFYLGKHGHVVRDGVKKVLNDIFLDIKTDNQLVTAPISFLTQSLGSKVLTDAMLCESEDEAANSLIALHANTLTNTRSIYLIANQIPLLNRGAPFTPCSSAGFTSFTNSEPKAYQSNWGLIADAITYQKWRRARTMSIDFDAEEERFNLVVFTDPNDLLSYQVSRNDAGNNVTISNIAVSNSKTYFKAIENPLAAHSDYLKNKDVLRLLRWGSNREK